jgi:predicted metal-dependent hydrolase
MPSRLRLGKIHIEVVQKDIKNVHLSVHPPAGRVRIAAPAHMKLDTIRVFAISKLDWIRQQQAKLRKQDRETARDYVDRESHYVWGKRYLLKVIEQDAAPRVELTPRTLRLHVRPGADRQRKRIILEGWYREQLHAAVPLLLAQWEQVLGVKAARYFVQHMKTKWGSCNSDLGNIRLNTELAKKPPQCLEYIIVHEVVHLLEPSHNARFVLLMDQFMPDWRTWRDLLNQLPVRHEEWDY